MATLRYHFFEIHDDIINDKIKNVFNEIFSPYTYGYVIASFLTVKKAWSPPIRMFLDTGGGLTILTLIDGLRLGYIGIHEDGSFTMKVKHAMHEVTGIARRKECRIPTAILKTKARLIDEYGNSSKEFNIWTGFTLNHENKYRIFGMKNALENFKIRLDPKANMITITEYL